MKWNHLLSNLTGFVRKGFIEDIVTNVKSSNLEDLHTFTCRFYHFFLTRLRTSAYEKYLHLNYLP